MADSFGYGQLQPEDSGSDFNAMSFLVAQALGRVRVAIPAVVKSVTGGGASAVPPVVSVQVLASMVDGAGTVTPHGTIFNVPTFRLQCANGAVVADPVAGDVGLLVVCDRDISVVQSSGGKVSQPGSWRSHDLADGVYIGGLFNAAPTQYVGFDTNGVTVTCGGDTAASTSSHPSAVLSDKTPGQHISVTPFGITLQCKGSVGVTISDVAGNQILLNSTGVKVSDFSGNQVVTTTAGMVLNAATGQPILAQISLAGTAASSALGKFPTYTSLLSGSGTYNPPAGCVRIRGRMIGGGGGGASTTTAGSNGSASSFGGWVASGAIAGNPAPGAGGVGGVGGADGTGTRILRVAGGQGAAGVGVVGGGNGVGGVGGSSAFGGGGSIQQQNNGLSAAANSGCGGGGQSGNGNALAGGGGGAGEYVEFVVNNPTSVSYAVGGGGAGATGGGAGGSGCILIEEFYN